MLFCLNTCLYHKTPVKLILYNLCGDAVCILSRSSTLIVAQVKCCHTKYTKQTDSCYRANVGPCLQTTKLKVNRVPITNHPRVGISNITHRTCNWGNVVLIWTVLISLPYSDSPFGKNLYSSLRVQLNAQEAILFSSGKECGSVSCFFRSPRI